MKMEAAVKKESKSNDYDLLYFKVGKTGFEPATPWSQTRCATGLRYFPENLNNNSILNCSREDRVRTCDPLVPNQVRYRTALLPYSTVIDDNLRLQR